MALIPQRDNRNVVKNKKRLWETAAAPIMVVCTEEGPQATTALGATDFEPYT